MIVIEGFFVVVFKSMSYIIVYKTREQSKKTSNDYEFMELIQSGTEVIKLFSCSTQVSLKFFRLHKC